MRPMLAILQDGQEHSAKDLTQTLADNLALTPEQRDERVSSGQSKFANRVGWARTYLKKAELIEDTKRAHYKITPLGLSALAQNTQEFDLAFLEQYPGFRAFRYGAETDGTAVATTITSPIPDGAKTIQTETPEDGIERLHNQIQDALAEELLEVVQSCSPYFFEHLVVDLLGKIYGGVDPQMRRVTSKSGDGGIDGFIKQDPLGLDTVYVQAKRWEQSVGAPEIQKFVGALAGRRSKKGVFITTSDYTSGAREYARTTDFTVVLVSGNELARLMIQHDVGVSVQNVTIIKRIDTDYFAAP